MRNRYVRSDLFRKDPHCFWCGVLTVEQVEPLLPNSATLEHLYPSRHPFRRKKNRQKVGFARNALLYVLACWQCNKERGYKETEGQVFIPKLDHRIQIAIQSSPNAPKDCGEGSTGCADDGDVLSQALRGLSHQDLNQILDKHLYNKE